MQRTGAFAILRLDIFLDPFVGQELVLSFCGTNVVGTQQNIMQFLAIAQKHVLCYSHGVREHVSN